MLGSVIGSVLMRITIGWDIKSIAPNQMALCNIGALTPSGALVAEVMFTFILLFPCFGIAFEPKQGQVCVWGEGVKGSEWGHFISF